MYLKYLSAVTCLLLMISSKASGQALVKAPKQYSIEVGYRLMLNNELIPEGKDHGFGFMFDYAWQLSGYSGNKRPVYLSVPLGYWIIPGSEPAPAQRMFNYGWTVRHMLSKNRSLQPFVGYALLLNQVSVADRPGQLFGHQTRFAAGLNFRAKDNVKPYISIEYSLSRHPRLEDPISYWIHFMGVKAGVRYK